MRFAHTQVWPALRYFEAIAPFTAISMSASSKTMNGALPPSSSDSFLTVPADCSVSSLPMWAFDQSRNVLFVIGAGSHLASAGSN